MLQFKNTYFIWLLSVCCCHTQAATVVEALTADFDVIVVVIETDGVEAPPSELASDWEINSVQPIAIGRRSYVNNEGLPVSGNYPVTVRHHMYLQLPQVLVDNQTYLIDTPFTNISLSFDDGVTRSEAIKVNQEGYYPDSNVRYANLGVYLGSLGSHQFPVAPDYQVFREADNTMVFNGTSVALGIDDQSGDEYVYRLDLSSLENGGPYYIVIPGMGRSHNFAVSDEVSQNISEVFFRGLYHQRCGIALVSAHTDHTRGICHVTAEVTDAEPPGFITLNGPSRTVIGGYHDAGDFDRRQSHTLIPAWLLNLYDAFPSKFHDGEYQLPESTNGIPDILDEAMWGVLLWENLQETDGSVRAGTETNNHPVYGVDKADTDSRVYRTYRRDAHATASAVGLFSQAARLIAPYNQARSIELQTKAISAWNWLQLPGSTQANDAQIMYGALQLYLLTGQNGYHDVFNNMVNNLQSAGWPQQYHARYFDLNTIVAGMIFTPYFTSYLYTNLPTDNATKAILENWLIEDAQYSLQLLNNRAYPLGTTTTAWGSSTAQGRYADPLIYLYRINGDTAYIDAISQLADYSLGLNPLGKSFVTGLGDNQIQSIAHLDSYFSMLNGLGSVPGITIYGPSVAVGNVPWEYAVWQHVYPAWNSLPNIRKFSDGWSLIPVSEFSTWEVTAPNAVMHAFLYAMLQQADLIFENGFENFIF